MVSNKLTLSPSKVHKAHEARGFLSSLLESGLCKAGPSGLSSEGCSGGGAPFRESSTSKKGIYN